VRAAATAAAVGGGPVGDGAELGVVARVELPLQALELLLLLGLLDHDQLVLAHPAGEDAVEVVEQDQPGRDGEQHADPVEQAHREARGGRGHAEVDDGLLPAAHQEQPGGVEHQQDAHDQAGLLAGRGQPLDQGVDAEVAVLAHGDDGAQEGEPDEQEARDLLRERDARVEGVAQDDVAEDEDDHQRQAQRDRDLEQVEVGVHDPCHSRPPCRRAPSIGAVFSSS
jgi:hypothetical protein